MDAIQRLHAHCSVYVEDFNEFRNIFDGYPHRHVFVLSKEPFSSGGLSVLPRMFWAVETLEGQGWRAVSWYLEAGHSPGVVMRRDLA